MRLRFGSTRRIESRPAPRARERGAVLVEFAFVAMILCVMVAGAWDFGQGWRAGLAATESTRTGVHVGSGMGDDVTADFEVLTGMRANLSSSGLLDEVERVVIFEATAANGGKVPNSCRYIDGGSCHIISGDAFRSMGSVWNASDYETDGCLKAATSKGFCPTSREDTQLDADTLGVYVRLRHDNMFQLVGDEIVIERNAAMRLEPPQD